MEGKRGGNNRLIDGPGRTWCLTNGKPRWQDGREKELKGRNSEASDGWEECHAA